MSTITSSLEDDDETFIDYYGETLTVTLQLIKIKFRKKKFQEFKVVTFWAGRLPHSATTNPTGAKTSKDRELIIGHCVICDRKKISDR